MPIITLEVMPDSSIAEMPYDSVFSDSQSNNIIDESTIDENMKDSNGIPCLKHEESAGMHFLVDKTEPTEIEEQKTDSDVNMVNLNVRTDLLEYTIKSDGSVICKLCGQYMASRTQWYKHKYKVHTAPTVNPAPLFQCEQCLVYFKSRKGYIGHIASKHSETLQDASPVLTNAQAEALAKEKSVIQKNPVQLESSPLEPTQLNPVNLEPSQPDMLGAKVKKEPDPELSIPKTIVPTYQNVTEMQTTTDTPAKRTRSMRQNLPRGLNILDSTNVENKKQWKEKRSREEKLVADIIARVRRECEAQGSGGAARRGYSRKSVRT